MQDDSLFKRFCCVNRIISAISDLSGKDHLINATAPCFKELNYTRQEQLKVVISYFVNDTFPYKESQCGLSHECDKTTTAANSAYVGIWLMMLALIIVSNLTVILAVQRISYLKQNNANLFISSLAVSDLLVGLFIIPIKIKFALNNLRFCSSEIVCRFYLTTDAAFFSTTITNLVVISVDRYLALNYPYKYPTLVTRRRSKILIALIWLYGCTWGSLINIKWDNVEENPIRIKNYQCMHNHNYIYISVIYTIVFYIPVVIMGIIYFRILTLARRHAKGISESVYFNNNNEEDDKTRRSSSPNMSFVESASPLSCDAEKYNTAAVSNDENRINSPTGTYLRSTSKAIQVFQYRKMIFKASKTVATVYGTFVLCWLPVSGLSLALLICRNCFEDLDLKWFYIIFVEVLPVFNSMMNPFIYALMNKQYRKAFKSILDSVKKFGPLWLHSKKLRKAAATETTMSTVM